MNRETCIDDQECVRFAGGKKKIQGKCDQHTQKCVMPNSVKTCGPLCPKNAFYGLSPPPDALYCVTDTVMYAHCDQCFKDSDCIQYNLALRDPDVATRTAKCEYAFVDGKKEGESSA